MTTYSINTQLSSIQWIDDDDSSGDGRGGVGGGQL